MSEAIDSYLENLKNPKHLEDIKRLRGFLLERLPANAEEVFVYNMPSYQIGEHIVVSLNSQKNYMSLYMDMEVVERHRDALGKLDCGKSCIRFRKVDDLPLEVIETILIESIAKIETV